MGNYLIDEKLDTIKVENNDFSFIYTVIQLLYNLKNNIKKTKVNFDNSKTPLFSLFKKIFEENDKKKIDLEKQSKYIYKIITEKYNLKIGDSPGKIIIQILEILNLEENNGYVNDSGEKYIMANFSSPMQLFNLNMSFNAFEKYYKKKNNGIISQLFHGYYLTTNFFPNSMSNMYIFNYYSVYELNVAYIHNQLRKEKISLFECINELKKPKKDVFNGIFQCLVSHNIYTLPRFLIFFMKREDNNNNNNFYGDITLETECDFSSVLFQNNNNNNKYKLIHIIKQKRYMVKQQEKKKENYNDWYEADEQNNSMSNHKYLFITRDNNDKYNSYDDSNYNQKYSLEENELDYYNHIFVYERQ